MSESLIYTLKEGITRVGRSDAPIHQDVQLGGLAIMQEHCMFEYKDGAVTLIPKESTPAPLIFVNGVQIHQPQKLTHVLASLFLSLPLSSSKRLYSLGNANYLGKQSHFPICGSGGCCETARRTNL
jgi:hypothetical protein